MLKVHHRPRRRLLHRLVEGAHQLDAGPLLGLKGVPVLVQGNRGVGVAQQLGEGHRIHPLLQGSGGKGMPLRYNYDKPEKPRISRVFGYLARFFILFQTEKSSREVVIS